ncbi:sensor domain-containing diguanylate cyclase [Psychrilyobacter atlanticus]|uniref:sensor domain-containing diguanylate cyclase n=1 Tax=Psychrilyobacter atlanticus TaxID=271091 RepID=UPI00040391BB|nr:sensor domain-containing diguanylate cyclase [Psychrilyobacter atlanticus]
MKNKKVIHFISLSIIIIPIFLVYYFLNYKESIWKDPGFHYYYVILSSSIAVAVSWVAFKEYKKTRSKRIFLISLGFHGVGVLYTFHAFITPGKSLFTFSDIQTHIKAFIFFGDSSRLWIALMLFSPEILKGKDDKKNYSSKVLLVSGLILILFSVIVSLNPEILPNAKTSDGKDTVYSILFKVVTLILLGITALKYFYSYKIKPNLSVLSLLIGVLLIMETVVTFMISKPWGSVWWLAHNLFLLSYISMGSGILYSLLTNKKFEYFDVLGKMEEYVKNLKVTNKELNILANIDLLTDLPNRSFFMNILKKYIAKSKKENNTFAVLFMDLDGFKKINDTYGHDTGDKVLKLAAKRIKGSIKKEDIVARLGGDEFIAILRNIERGFVSKAADRILSAVNNPMNIDGNICDISVSIGISLFPYDGTNISELMRKSDKAMYRVKKKSKNNYTFYSESSTPSTV